MVSSEHHRRGQTVVEGREQKVCCKMASLDVTAKTHLQSLKDSCPIMSGARTTSICMLRWKVAIPGGSNPRLNLKNPKSMINATKYTHYN